MSRGEKRKKPTGMERERAGAAERQRKVACGGFGFDGDGNRKKAGSFQ